MRFSLLPTNQRQFARTMSMMALASCNKDSVSLGDDRPVQPRLESQRTQPVQTNRNNANAI